MSMKNVLIYVGYINKNDDEILEIFENIIYIILFEMLK